MKAVGEVALPVAPDPPELLGSLDGSVGGRSNVALGRDVWQTEVAGASVGKKGKNQTLKEKNNFSCGRGDKRNTKVRCKNKHESSFSKNGLIGFSSNFGVNDFSGKCGQTPDALDISKYVEEMSLDELLKGGCSYPRVSEEKGKRDAESNAIVLQSVQKVCSIFGAQKVLQAENRAELENDSVLDVSTALPPDVSDVEQTDEATRGVGNADHMSCDKVQDSVGKIKSLAAVYPPLHHPRDILDRLVLPQPTVSDLLLSDRSKVTSSRNSSDTRSAKAASYQCGLPPFPWSHSFSGHNKLGLDALKLSACRALCQGRWVSVNSSVVCQKGSESLPVDFESLKFNQSLVPPVSCFSEQPEDRIAATERLLSSSVANSSLQAHGDDFAAAHTLLHIAAQSMGGPSETLKSTRNSSQIAAKSKKLNVTQRSNKVSDDSKPKTRQSSPFKIGGDGFPLKKRRLSMDDHLHDQPVRRGPPHRSASSLIKSRHTKLLSAGRYVSDSNHVHKSFIKPRRISEWPDSSRHKFWRSAV